MKFLTDLVKNKNTYYALFGLGIVIYVALLFFRLPTHDETLYLQETYTISQLIKHGHWFGDFGVGLHGFLFKLPVALMFLITGPSSLLATLFNYVIAIASLYLTFKISKTVLKKDIYANLCVLLFLFSFEFVRSTPTYLRDIPSVFSVLLFTYLYIKDCKRWVLGLSMLLVLDAKEYMFFVVGLAYVVSRVTYLLRRGVSISNVWNFILENLIVFIPSLLFVLLMFTTSLIPINMFLASILGLISRGLGWNSQQFSVASGTSNVVNSGDIREIPLITLHLANSLINTFIHYLNIGIGYIGKFLYPRSFSYLSIPKLLFIPSLFFGFKYFKDGLKKEDNRNIIFLIVIIFLAIFILRNSHGRYLFSIAPFIFIFFVGFLKSISKKNYKYVLLVLTLTWVFECMGLYFETTWQIFKILISLLIFVSMLALVYVSVTKKSIKNVIIFLVCGIIFSVSFLSSITFSYTQGQIFNTLKFGYDFEQSKIVSVLSGYKHIYFNNTHTGSLIPFYLGNTYVDPLWKWDLKSWIPKRDLVKYYGVNRIETVESLDNLVMDKDTVLVLFKSKVKGNEFNLEKLIPGLQSSDRYSLIKKVDFKGKEMYIFKANESNR